jgi:hypothetical protein
MMCIINLLGIAGTQAIVQPNDMGIIDDINNQQSCGFSGIP